MNQKDLDNSMKRKELLSSSLALKKAYAVCTANMGTCYLPHTKHLAEMDVGFATIKAWIS